MDKIAGDAGAKVVHHLRPKEDGELERPLQNPKFIKKGMGMGRKSIV